MIKKLKCTFFTFSLALSMLVWTGQSNSSQQQQKKTATPAPKVAPKSGATDHDLLRQLYTLEARQQQQQQVSRGQRSGSILPPGGLTKGGAMQQRPLTPQSGMTKMAATMALSDSKKSSTSSSFACPSLVKKEPVFGSISASSSSSQQQVQNSASAVSALRSSSSSGNSGNERRGRLTTARQDDDFEEQERGSSPVREKLQAARKTFTVLPQFMAKETAEQYTARLKKMNCRVIKEYKQGQAYYGIQYENGLQFWYDLSVVRSNPEVKGPYN